MKRTYNNRNNPIAIVIKNYIDKKSGKVTESRDEIKRRFAGLDWRDQKRILMAFLDSGKVDRNWAYSELLRIWDKSFEQNVLELWETYREEKCARVVIRHCSEKYVLKHLEDLSDNRNYYFICLRLAGNKDFVIDKSRLSGQEYVAVIKHTGQELSHAEVADILYSEVCEWCLDDDPMYWEPWTFQRRACFSVSEIPSISRILYYINEMGLCAACVAFNKWEYMVNEEILGSIEKAELSKRVLSDWEYCQRLVFIEQKYMYHALPQQYKTMGDEEFDQRYAKKMALLEQHDEMMKREQD